MRVIQISQENFETLFNKCLLELKLETVQNERWVLCNEIGRDPTSQFASALREMHRRFHHCVATLETNLERG